MTKDLAFSSHSRFKIISSLDIAEHVFLKMGDSVYNQSKQGSGFPCQCIAHGHGRKIVLRILARTRMADIDKLGLSLIPGRGKRVLP